MAEIRTNMVSLLDIGLIMGKESQIVEMGDGFNELTESWGPEIDTKQYVNMKAKSSTLKGFEFSMTPEREYISDDLQKAIDYLFKNFPVGKACETFYYRYYKTDIKGNTGECIKVPVIVAPDSTGGSGGDPLTSSIQLSGNGDVVKGTVTITESGWTFAEAASASS